ncbi:response regulator transcription factor [Flavihumibacter sp. CACIAM 22H1]|uniref:helix-turn-helix domain-containing protein n=1 Tax=Flavihumibacter sp. CACIAM 22H1 TaxID=1812911 RepID=UPI0007A8AF1F|nr:response regulator transcription factor [Flavihumibacter sp. CACIAM 22H1]KYP12942.1 MAG: AraC family transcriptional regulator [Flavihumibacter sp. CACIAM 22H1]MDF2379983.1 helix-turn-helix transcriptional regulator [Nostoc ellipsosporum NOK]
MNAINSISEFHRLLSLPEPHHPLVSVINLEDSIFLEDEIWKGFVNRFYCVALKREAKGKIRYGQQHYDYDKGVLSFTKPNQVQQLDLQNMECGSGYLLIFHPDFLLQHTLATDIHHYGFFDYAVNEALHLSAEEEDDLISILHKIDKECRHIDAHTQDIILTHIESLLKYSNRFYERQFLTRKTNNSALLTRFEQLLDDYFNNEIQGLLTVQYVAAKMNLSPNYLSDLLRVHTGQNTQQHIHEKLIAKAKEKLSTTDLSVSEIAYALGFEHAQSFSTLFKKKTNLSPVEFRQGFN